MISPWDAVMKQVTRLADRLDASPEFREATLTSKSSPAVRFDTDIFPTLVKGILSPTVQVNQRVLTMKIRHYVWVLGSAADAGYQLVLPDRLAGFPVNVIVDTNAVFESGWYLCNASTLNMPVATSNGHLRVYARSSTNVRQEYTRLAGSDTRVWARNYAGSAWTAWELVGGTPGADPTTPTAASGWGIYGAHPSGTPSGTPTLRYLGGSSMVAIRAVLRNESGASISFGSGVVVATGLPAASIANFNLSLNLISASEPGAPSPDIGVFVTGTSLKLRGTGSLANNGILDVSGVYPLV